MQPPLHPQLGRQEGNQFPRLKKNALISVRVAIVVHKVISGSIQSFVWLAERTGKYCEAKLK